MAVVADELQVGQSQEYLDTTLVETGTKHSPTHREGVFIGDPEDGNARAEVGKVPAKGDALAVRLADGFQLDAFSRLRVSQPTTLFDAQQEYGLNTLWIWDAAANSTYASYSSNGSAVSGSTSVGPADQNTKLTPITAAPVDGQKAVIQSRQYARYIPAKSQFIPVTGIFADGPDDTASLVLRSNTSGTPDEREIQQANWNVDKFDGTGPSKITLDFTKTQIFVIDAQALYAGRVRCGFEVDGIPYLAHEFLNANILSIPYIGTFNLPVRAEALVDATGTSFCAGYFDLSNGVFVKLRKNGLGGTMQFLCCSVQSEGGQEARGFPFTARNSANITVPNSGLVPILSVRPAATFNGRINRAHIEIAEFIARIASNDCEIVIIYNATLTGAVWTGITNSCTEFDISASALTGGTEIQSDWGIAGGGVNRGEVSGGATQTRTPLTISKIDGLTTRQPSITVAAKSIGAGNASARAILNWYEQTV